MAIKVNKKKFMKQLRAAIKARKTQKNVLEGGLFVPNQNDIQDEVVRLPAFQLKKEISHE